MLATNMVKDFIELLQQWKKDTQRRI